MAKATIGRSNGITLIYDDFGAIMLTPNAFASVAGSAAVADLTSVAVSLAGAVR